MGIVLVLETTLGEFVCHTFEKVLSIMKKIDLTITKDLHKLIFTVAGRTWSGILQEM